MRKWFYIILIGITFVESVNAQTETKIIDTNSILKNNWERVLNYYGDSVFDFDSKTIKKGEIMMRIIVFSYNKVDILPESTPILDSLLVLFEKHPKLILEVSNFTDYRGNEEYNIRLSQRRAESIIFYLENKGVSKYRIIARGYGESKPIFSEVEIKDLNTNFEKENMHYFNRRTEFKVLKN